jgi:hypothetical protein
MNLTFVKTITETCVTLSDIVKPIMPTKEDYSMRSKPQYYDYYTYRYPIVVQYFLDAGGEEKILSATHYAEAEQILIDLASAMHSAYPKHHITSVWSIYTVLLLSDGCCPATGSVSPMCFKTMCQYQHSY